MEKVVFLIGLTFVERVLFSSGTRQLDAFYLAATVPTINN